MLVLAQIPPARYKAWAPWFYLMGVILLVAVLVIGESGQGAKRWLNLGIIRFQPSEMIKLSLLLFMAYSLAKKREKMESFKTGILPHILVVGLMMGVWFLSSSMAERPFVVDVANKSSPSRD